MRRREQPRTYGPARSPRVKRRDPARIVALSALAVVVALFVSATAKVLLVLFAGTLLGVVLRGTSRAVNRISGIPPKLALALIVLLFLGGLVFGAVMLAPSLDEQFHALREQLPHAIAKLRDIWRHSPIPKNLDGKPAALPDIKLPTLAALGGTVEVISALVVIFFVGVYTAAQPRVYVRAAAALTPQRYRARVESALDCAGHNLSRWLLGRGVAMLFVGVGTTIAFYALHLPIAGLLGLVAGLLTFIEYAGALISAIPPVLLALTQSPTQALWVVALFTGVHVIEGYILTPLLTRTTVHIPPGITLASQVLLAVLVGPLGLTFSTPLLVVLISATKAWERGMPVRRGTALPGGTDEPEAEEDEARERAGPPHRTGWLPRGSAS